MVAPAPQIRYKTNKYRCICMFWRYSWYLQRLKYHENHNNIVVFAMFWKYSWCLQYLKYDTKHNNIVVFAMLRRYSWYLQRLKCNGKCNNIVTFAMFRRYSWYLQRLKYAEKKHNNIGTFAIPRTLLMLKVLLLSIMLYKFNGKSCCARKVTV